MELQRHYDPSNEQSNRADEYRAPRAGLSIMECQQQDEGQGDSKDHLLLDGSQSCLQSLDVLTFDGLPESQYKFVNHFKSFSQSTISDPVHCCRERAGKVLGVYSILRLNQCTLWTRNL